MKNFFRLILLSISILISCKKKNTGIPPLPPSLLVAEGRSTTQIYLSWTDNSTNESGFKIERKTSGGSYSEISSLNPNITNYADQGLIPNTSYTYRVYTFNESGKSITYSNEATATTAEPVPIGASDLAALAVSASSIELTWKDNAINETGYKLERKTGNSSFDQIANITSNSIAFKDTGLQDNTIYTYRIAPYNASGTSTFSNEASDTTFIDILTKTIVYFPFNGNTGDSSGNNLHAVSYGAVLTSDRFGIANRAYAFDGTNEISVTHSDKLNLMGDLTISAWFYSVGPPTFATSHTIIAKRSNSEFHGFPYLLSINYILGTPSDYKKPMLSTAISNPITYQLLQSGTDVLNNSWNHLAAVVSGNNAKLYLNGIVVFDGVIDNSKRQSNSATLLIGGGGRSDKPAEQFVGKLDEIRIYSRALTGAQIGYLATH